MEGRKMKIKKEVITRRDFLQGSVATALGLTVLPDWLKAGMGKMETGPATDQKSLVLVVRDENVLNSSSNQVDKKVLEAMVGQVMTGLTGEKEMHKAWAKLFSPQDVVGLVPTSVMNPTHNELMEIITDSLLASGLPAANIRLAQGRSVDLDSISALICLPGLKAHWLTGIGTVIKNYILYSGAPRNYHYEDSTKLGEIWQLPKVKGKTRLIIVDALRPVCDRGPQFDPRYRWPYKGLLAGTDPVALDAVGLKIIQAKRDELRGEPWPISPPPICLEAADKIYKLGNSRLENIEIRTIGWKQDLLL
jgi:hypothetical protein